MYTSEAQWPTRQHLQVGEERGKNIIQIFIKNSEINLNKNIRMKLIQLSKIGRDTMKILCNKYFL